MAAGSIQHWHEDDSLTALVLPEFPLIRREVIRRDDILSEGDRKALLCSAQR